MVRNLLERRPEKLGDRPKALLLGMSYPSVEGHITHYGFDPSILTNKKPSVEQAVECVRRGIMTEMDGRDLARCVSTEKVCDMDVYTVSKEVGGVYRSDRHIYADFNARNFCSQLKEAFGNDVHFSQIVLDYYWMPTGWLVTRWARTLFQKTLPEFVKHNLLAFPSRRSKRRSSADPEVGVVYLPFCSHCCKEVIAAIGILEKYYQISFVKKNELPGHVLWKGTMDIDAQTMQTRLGKRLDQEELYCTFRPKDVLENMDDCHVTKPQIMRVLTAIEDYDDVRMIRLRPLRQHEPPSVLRERLIKPEDGGFVGLNFSRTFRKLKTGSPVKGQKDSPTRRPPLAKTHSTKLPRPSKGSTTIFSVSAEEPSKRILSKKKEAKRIPSKGPATKRLARRPPLVDRRKTTAQPKASTRTPSMPSQRKQVVKVRKENLMPKHSKPQKKPVYEDVEVATKPKRRIDLIAGYGPKPIATNEIPPITYFYPSPAIDLTTFNDPVACAEDDDKPLPGKPRTARRVLITRGQSLEGDDVQNADKKSVQYLTTNPRCIRKQEQPRKHENGMELFVPKDAGRNFELEGACTLFEMQVGKVKSVSRRHPGRSEIAIVKRLKRDDTVDSLSEQNNMKCLASNAEIEQPKQVSSEDWMDRLEPGDKVLLEQFVEELKQGRMNGISSIKTKTLVTDRVRNLNDIVRWLLLRKDDLDPTGDFCKIESELGEGQNKGLVERAHFIEKTFSAQQQKGPGKAEAKEADNCGLKLSAAFQQAKKEADQQQAQLEDNVELEVGEKCRERPTATSTPPLPASHPTEESTVELGKKNGVLERTEGNAESQEGHESSLDDRKDDDDSNNREFTRERSQLFRDIQSWLEDPQDSNDPTGEFRRISSGIPKTTNDAMVMRAQSIEEKITFLRCLDPCWYCQDWINQSPNQNRVDRKRVINSLGRDIGKQTESDKRYDTTQATEHLNEEATGNCSANLEVVCTSHEDQRSAKRRHVEVTPERYVDGTHLSGSSTTEENPVCVSPTPPSSECEGWVSESEKVLVGEVNKRTNATEGTSNLLT